HGVRRHAGLQGDRPSPHAGDRPRAGRARRTQRRACRRARADLRATPDALRPRRAGELLRPDQRASRLQPGALLVRGALRRRALRRGDLRAARRERRPGHEPLPDPSGAQRGLRARAGLRLDRQPLEGSGIPGDPEPQPDARPARGGGNLLSATTETFFRSRWVEPPQAVEELDASQLAPGFRAAGVACGLKGSGATDVGVLTCDEEGAGSALALTANAAAAAPVRVCRNECDAAAIRAVAVNSGNANAATGKKGYSHALAMRDGARLEPDGLGHGV